MEHKLKLNYVKAVKSPFSGVSLCLWCKHKDSGGWKWKRKYL